MLPAVARRILWGAGAVAATYLLSACFNVLPDEAPRRKKDGGTPEPDGENPDGSFPFSLDGGGEVGADRRNPGITPGHGSRADGGKDAGDGGDAGSPDAGWDGGSGQGGLPNGVTVYKSLTKECATPYFTLETMEAGEDVYISCQGKEPSFLFRGADSSYDRDISLTQGQPVFHSSLGNGRYFVPMASDENRSNGYHTVDTGSQSTPLSYSPLSTFIISSGDPTIEYPLAPISGFSVRNGRTFLSTDYIGTDRTLGAVLLFDTATEPWRVHTRLPCLSASLSGTAASGFLNNGDFVALNTGGTGENGSVDRFHYDDLSGEYDAHPSFTSQPLSPDPIQNYLFPMRELFIQPQQTSVYTLRDAGAPMLFQMPLYPDGGEGSQQAVDSLNGAVTGFAYDGADTLFVGDATGKIVSVRIGEEPQTLVEQVGSNPGFLRYYNGALYMFVDGLTATEKNPQILKLDLNAL